MTPSNPHMLIQKSPTHWVYDYETLSNCFVAVFQHYKDEHLTKVFQVWKGQNDAVAFIDFLKQTESGKQWQIGFNNIAFDAQITHYILKHEEKFKKMTGQAFARHIYKYAQEVIRRSEEREFQDFSPKKMSIMQVDLFKMNHWDNKAKICSLKWLQYAMDWVNIEEMPIDHTTEITSKDQVEQIIKYCLNDVRSTARVLHHSKGRLSTRMALSKEYGLNLYSASEPKLAKEIFGQILTKELGLEPGDLKRMGTKRDHIVLADCILPCIAFKNPVFQQVLDYMKSKVITETKGALEYEMEYKGVKSKYGLGGLHGARGAGIYEATPGYKIITSDVVSFYPTMAIEHNLSPEHLPKKEFCKIYKDIFDARVLIPKSDPRNYIYKILLNSTYGLSNEMNSFFYDPKFTMTITINGQLMLTMFYEMILERIPGAVPLMQNTDGVEFMIPASYEQEYLKISKEWEAITKLKMEHDNYSKMIIADVNSYIAVYTNGKTKAKGRFEFAPMDRKDVETLHKDKSFLVIPKAIYEYFINGVKPEDYLESNKNIFDYCAGVRAKGPWRFVSMQIQSGVLKTTQMNKIVRYYMSKSGCKLIKRHQLDGRESQVEAGMFLQTVVNDVSTIVDKDFDELGINKEYYLQQIYKEIHNVNDQVTRLFTQLEMSF